MIRLLAGVGAFVLLWAGCSRSHDLPKAPEHGTAFVARFDGAKGTDGVERLKSVFRRRLERFGAKFFIEQIATNELRVSVPKSEAEKVGMLKDLLTFGGTLEMRLVHAESERFVAAGLPAVGHDLLVEQRATPVRGSVAISNLVKRTPEISELHFERVSVQRDPITEAPNIVLKFDQEGTAAFTKVTAQNVGRNLALVLDGKILTAPRINEPITGGLAVISGGNTTGEAFVIAAILEMPLPFPVTVTAVKTY